MNSMRGIIPVGPQTWKGARLIAIDALPGTLPSSLQSDVLVRCQQENTSVELCLTTDRSAPGEVKVWIILRSVSGYPYEALDRLERVSGMIRQRLSAANIRCHATDTEGEARGLERFFGGELAPISAAAGFFPAEGAPNPGGIYIPGQYGLRDAHPVALGQLATLLSAYPDAMLSLQLNITRLYPQERKLVRENLNWFAARGNDPVARKGREAFSRLDSVADEPLFLICFTCIGSEDCVRDIAAQARLSALCGYRLPRIEAQNGSYAVRGNEWISEACVRSGHEAHCLQQALTHMGRLTHLAPLGAATAAFALPQYTGEVKGVRVNRIPSSREPLPAALTQQDGIYLGRHFDSEQPVFVRPDDLTRHGFFVGKPGSGKTTFALGLLHRLYSHPNRYPFLVFEPAKTEYRSLMERIPDLRVYTPGREDVAPIQLNPFLPPKGVRLEQYQQNLEAIFAMAVSVDHPLDIIFPQVISRCYTRYGWRPGSTRDSAGVRVFGMHEFIRVFREYIQEHYSGDPESEHNLENGGVVRLMALMKTPMFDTDRSLDVDALLERPTVIELDALNNASHKALVMGIILTQLMLVMQRRGNAGGKLRNLILVDEAHLLLGQSEGVQSGPKPAQAVVELLQNMTLILRAYGTALMFGDQSPARLTNVILDNVDLKVMFRLDSRQDRAILSETALMDDGMTAGMVTLPVGEGYLHCGALNAPVHIVTPNSDQALQLNRAMSDERVRDHMRVSLKPPFAQCAACGSCDGRCDPGVRADGQFLASQLMDRPEVVRCLADPERQRELLAFIGGPLERVVMDIMGQFQISASDPRLVGCARAQFLRALLIAPQCVLSERELTDLEGDGRDRRHEGSTPGQPVGDRFQDRVTYSNILEMCATPKPEGSRPED